MRPRRKGIERRHLKRRPGSDPRDAPSRSLAEERKRPLEREDSQRWNSVSDLPVEIALPSTMDDSLHVSRSNITTAPAMKNRNLHRLRLRQSPSGSRCPPSPRDQRLSRGTSPARKSKLDDLPKSRAILDGRPHPLLLKRALPYFTGSSPSLPVKFRKTLRPKRAISRAPFKVFEFWSAIFTASSLKKTLLSCLVLAVR